MTELKTNRRNFITHLATGLTTIAFSGYTNNLSANFDTQSLTILHTNDVHSRIDPFPMDGSINQGKGGVARRSALIKQIRKQEEHVLLLDAGDIFQGTPYFNLWGGELEIKLMSLMGYDASIMGNHDFDNGVEGFAKQLKYANFPILNANYNFTDTAMEGKSKDYNIFKKGKIKIGVYGLGIELTGLVNKLQYGETKYLDPISKAREIEKILKFDEKCNLIICLSHLGYSYKENKVSDIVLAQNSLYTDLIIGGHTHTFLPYPTQIKNLLDNQTLVNQVGFGGINLGRIDYTFNKLTSKKIKYSSQINAIKNDLIF
jgi:5'-nucleotidase